MKNLLLLGVMAVLLFGFDAVCDEACYYKVAVSGKADCHNGQYCQDVCDYPEPELGSAVYYLYQDGILIPKCEGIENWGFRLYTGHAIASFCVSDDSLCELTGWGEAYFDPNSTSCDSENSSATITVDLIFSETCCGFDIECGGFSVTITPICSCEDLMQNVGGSGCEDSEPNGVTCYCDDGLQDKATDKIEGQTAEGDNGPTDTAKDPVEGDDPVILKSGALISSIADIHVPGRMMDINLVRTYKGDMNDPGFGHSYYGPWQDKIICIDDELKYYVTGFGTSGEGDVIETGEWGYQFLRISDVDYTFDTDVFDVNIPDPSDPNTPSEEYGKVYFKDYDGGSFTIEYRYEIYAACDPTGLSAYIIGLSGDTYSKTFDYNIDPGAGRLGRKWTHNYDISLERFDIEQDEETTTQYLLYDGGGKKLLFTEPNSLIGWGSTPYFIDLYGRNGFICPTDKSRILLTSDEQVRIINRGGDVWLFDNNLRLSKIEDTNGNQLTFTYQNVLGFTGQNLYQITNDVGNYIIFHYDFFNMIDYITDNFGRTWEYNKNGDFDLIEVVKPILGSDSENITNTYTYEEGSLLATATDGAGQTWLENTYNALDRIIEQRYGTASYNNGYHIYPDLGYNYVSITDRSGNQQTVHMTETGLIRKREAPLDAYQTAVTEYFYDFDDTGEDEMESKCLVTKIAMPAGDIYEYEYDHYGNTTAVIHKSDACDEGLRTEYTYTNNVSSFPLSMTDAAGNTTLFTYSSGNITKITLPEILVTDVNDISNVYAVSPEYNFVYNQYGQIRQIVLPDNRNIDYSYHTDGGKYLVKYITYAGGTYTLDYDAKGNLTSITDPDGIVTNYTYDNISRLTEVVNALNSRTKLTYNDAGLVGSVKQQLGASFNENTAIHSTFEYTSVDKLKKITDTLGRITQLGFDNNDNVTQVTDPQGRASGYSTAYGYNAFDLLESITLPEDYDLTAGNQNVTTFTYTVDGLTSTATDAEGNTTSYVYDGYRRLIEIIYPDNTTLNYTYDDRSFITTETKRDGTTIYYNYDAIGRLTDKAIDGSNSYIGKNSSLIDYLKTGTWTATTDTESISGRYVTTTDTDASYTLLGEKTGRFAVAVRYPSFGASSNNNAKVEFGASFNPSATYYINQQINGDEWVYLGVADFNSLPEMRVRSNGSTNITAIDAVKFIPVDSFNYDIMGRLKKAPGYEFTYDAAGRLTAVTDRYNRTVSYEYTPAGRRSKLTWPDGFYVTYGYDEVGRLDAVYNSNDSLLWSCAYDAAGRRTQTTGIYGLTTDYDYEDIDIENNDNRGTYLEGLTHTLGANSLSYVYSRDSVGNITTEGTAGTEISYLYDKNYSLTAVDYETGDDLVYDYDNLFSRVMVTEGTAAANYTNYTNGLNQYSTIGTTDLEYDDNGNLTQYGTKHYLYDAENQMVAYYNLDGDPNNVVVSLYSYDDFGRRISKASAIGVESTAGIIAESYLYDGFQVIGQYTADSVKLKRRFIYAEGIDEPICMVVCESYPNNYNLENLVDFTQSWLSDNNSQDYNQSFDYNTDNFIDFEDFAAFVVDEYIALPQTSPNDQYYGYAFDGTGSVIALTYMNDPNQTGDPNETPYFVETYSYTPFGAVSIYDPTGQPLAQSAIGNPYMFTAREYDPESGLYYYRLRMYSPTLGRFMQTDPIGYYDSMNLYQYCLNNPVNYMDPWGLNAILLPGIGAGVGAGAGIGAGAGAVAGGVVAGGGIISAGYLGWVTGGLIFDNLVDPGLDWAFDKIYDGIINPKTDKNGDKPSDSARDAADKMANGKNPGSDWIKKGGKDGNWHNPKTGESLRPDDHEPFGPHVDWHGPKGPRGRFFPDGRFIPKK